MSQNVESMKQLVLLNESQPKPSTTCTFFPFMVLLEANFLRMAVPPTGENFPEEPSNQGQPHENLRE